MYNYCNPQKLVLIGVQNNEKMSFGHFIKHLKCTHYTCMLNNDEYMKILPKYMLFLPQGTSIQSKSSFKTKSNKKD